ncbi:hypothetical protein LSCM1_03861 [Leishmania martiniquensis]|uniref:Uncharacterized protein n=1 Tax=Leishmania martiniquensis TaxID=1580590 RepID=A0A836KH11_9TRYP|nr:hypothetical protein LSCM1_03861 [Leishmania martiniquensis]
MFKSSLATHSSIDHDLFPLLTVRSCVSEADESKNGPRFCAEDKMTGGAYEIRSRKLHLEAEELASGAAATGAGRNLSSNDLALIKRQQERINALLTAAAHCAVPQCVALPIDVYIQEQPSTGNTYVASVDAFSGLSLGDIIRSGWGVMEERVFLEILNTVEAFGYASASLPPHGNLSSDAIKQLLIVRDGASEARQPSRWVVSDWLLLSDDSVASFDPAAFVADLEWILHSSFAQLHISTDTQQGSTLMPANRVEELVSETVDRIRAHLLRHGATGQNLLSVDKANEPPHENSVTDANASLENAGASPSGMTDTDGTSARRPSDSNADGTSAVFHTTDENIMNSASTAAGGTLEPQANAASPPSSHSRCAVGKGGIVVEDQAKTAIVETFPSLSTPNTPLTASLVNNSTESSRSAADKRDSTKETPGLARQMSLKDKIAFHQAALRNEQLLVNRHRRKNAPLPPRPQPVCAQGRNPRTTLSPSPSEDEEEFYGAPSLTSPIEVKPSAYLMQGRRPSASGRGVNSARKPPSPRSARTPNGEARTPREHSRSTTAAPQSQQPLAASQSPASPDQLRERLLENVVSLAMQNQRRRAQIHRLHQEAERRRREQRQQALSLSTPPHASSGRDLAARVSWERPRAMTPSPAALSSFLYSPRATVAADNHRPTTRRSSTLLSGSAGGPSHGGSGVTLCTPPSLAAAPNGAAMKSTRRVSESPEPTPPSPCWCRAVSHTLCEKTPISNDSAGTPMTRMQESSRESVGVVLRSPAAHAAGKGVALPKTAPYPVGAGIAARGVRAAAVKATANARWLAAGAKVMATVTARSGGNSSRHSTVGAGLRCAEGSIAARNQGAGAVGQQQRSARTSTASARTQRSRGPASSSTQLFVQQTKVQQPTAALSAKPLPLELTRGPVAPLRAVATMSDTRNLPHASNDAGQPEPARKADMRPSSTSPRFSGDSSSPRVTCAEPEVLRCLNAARPLPGQLRLPMSPRVYRRVSSTGGLRSPRNDRITPPGRPSTAAMPSPPTGEPVRSARQTPTQTKPATPAELYTTEPRPRIAADAKSTKVFTSVNCKRMQTLALQTVWPKRLAGHTSARGTQSISVAPTSLSKQSLTSPRAPPPPPTVSAGAAHTVAVRQGARVNPVNENNMHAAENRTPRGRDTGEARASPGARPTTAREGAKQLERKNVTHVTALRSEPPTLGTLRPVHEMSPGILLRRHRSCTK